MILIDELDRIEDEEIRIVAQLVRSVADFPGISYVLAYDADRVIHALAGDDGNAGRGRAYLEKIVQLQFPLPVVLDNELHSLIEADLDLLAAEGLVPEARGSIERYTVMRTLLVPRIVATPRDVKRLMGTFSILVRMVGTEVDWIDLLGYCAILVKAPLTAEEIKRNPDLVADDPTSIDEITDRLSGHETQTGHLFDQINPEQEGGVALANLLGLLFPRLLGGGADRRYGKRPGTSICKMQPLLTTLRLDLVPGYFSREAVLDLFQRPESDVFAFLKANYDAGRIENFLTKLSDSREELTRLAQQAFWSGATRFLRKPDSEFLSASSMMYEIIRAFADVFPAVTGDQARSLLLNLIEQGEVELTASMLRSHILHWGLFGHSASHRQGVFIDAPWVEAMTRATAEKHRDQHLNGRFLWSLWDFTPVHTMVDAGIWDDACREGLKRFLADPHAVDALTLTFFGAHYTTARDFISKLTGLDEYLALVDQRLAAGDMHESVRVALEKAKNSIFGQV